MRSTGLDATAAEVRRPSYRFDNKSYMSFQLVEISVSVTLNDLEQRNDPYFALFHRIRAR